MCVTITIQNDMTYIALIIACIYFYFPAAFANIGANIGRFIPFFKDIKTPVDFGLRIKGKRIVGDHKVMGSFMFGVVFGSLLGVVKFLLLDPFMEPYLLLDLEFMQTVVLYTLMSTCALIGDIIKSILKRLFNIAPHKPWIPFDEIDHSTFSLLVTNIFFPLPWYVILLTITVYFFLHIGANIVGYKLRIKSVPY